MKLSRTQLFFSLACIPIFIHFFLLQQTLINYPNWGDDFLFLELLDYSNKHTLSETLGQLLIPHNQIHILVWAKSITLISYFISGSLNYKLLTILANIQWLAIFYIIYLYLKHKGYASIHLIGIACCLFAPAANLDNYSLLGSLSHTSSLLVLVSIAYLIENNTKNPLLILLFLIFPLVLTEGWAMFAVGSGVLLINKHPYTKIVAAISVFGLAIFALHLSHQTAAPSNAVRLLEHVPLAFFTFLGNFAWPISDTFRIAINATAGFLILTTSFLLFWKHKNAVQPFSMPHILWLQLLAITGMVCLGRNGGNLETLVLSERFHSYSTIALVATYLILIPNLNRPSWRMVLTSCTVIYFVGSLILFLPIRRQLKERMLADATNAYRLKSCTNYLIPTTNFRLVHDRKLFQWDAKDILPFQLPVKPKVKIAIRAVQDRELRLNIPAKTSQTDQRWLAVQSMANPDSTFLLAFTSDKPNKLKIARINSMQLTNFKYKNLWLFTLHRNQKSQIQYVGSLEF